VIAMIKVPALFLSFDDCHIQDWYNFLPFFQKHEIKATFYISNIKDLNVDDWAKIQKIQDDNHCIGLHGYSHIRAGLEVGKLGCKRYLEKEITPALALLSKHGITNVKHFSYPWGNRTPESDACLLKYFKTLRIGGIKNYRIGEVQKIKIINSTYIGMKNENGFRWRQKFILHTIVNKKVAFCYMHKPIESRLEWLVNQNINIYSMSEL